MARAAGVVAALTVISRVTGLVRDVVVGYLFGAGAAADAFFVAFRFPNLLRRLVGEGAATGAFVPVLTAYVTTGSRAEANRAARVLFACAALALAAITILGMVAAEPLARVFAPGFGAVPGKLELTVQLTRMVFPYVFFIGIVALATGVLNTFRSFAAPAVSPIVMNLTIIAAAPALAPWLGIRGLAVAVVLAGAAQALSQLAALSRLGVPLVPLWQLRHPVVGRVGRLMIPTVFGSAVYQINVLVSTMFASLLPDGSVAYLWYAERLFEFPLGVFAVAIGTAALPSFATLAKLDVAELRGAVGFALRLVNLIALPAAVGLAVTAAPLTSVLFMRGEFTAADAQQTSVAVLYYVVGLWSVAAVRVLVPAFYALEDTRTPVLTAAAAFGANLVFIVLLVGPLATAPEGTLATLLTAIPRAIGIADLRHGGLALATSLAATVNLGLLGFALHRRIGDFGLAAWARSTARTLIAALAMVPGVLAVTRSLEWFDATVPFATRLTCLGAAILVGMAVCGITLLALGGPEVAALRAGVRRKLVRR